jgi:hypothetical protein
MRPEDRRASLGWTPVGEDTPLDVPLEAGLTTIDAELESAGAQARRALHGRTQPTRLFSNDLRDRLLGTTAAPVATWAAAEAALPRDVPWGSRIRTGPTSGETWAPTPLQPRLARRTPTVRPRARWAVLAAAALTTVVVFGALGARFDWLVPFPTSGVTSPPATRGPETPRPAASVDGVLPIDSSAPTDATRAPATPKPTRKPEPTPKPEPTEPPVGAMGLVAKACPGGVVLDWTRPTGSVGHYHVLRNLDGGVPPVYPADGTAEIESATSWSAGVTDGFDVIGDGGASATYRAFAFGAEDQLLVLSPSRTVTTVAPRSLGTLTVEALGPGSISVSWGASEVPDGCFSYGKLVASADDPDQSYVKGSPHLVAVGSQATTNVTVNELPSGQTVWMRYELIRVTGTGAFVVGRTDVVQVTYP